MSAFKSRAKSSESCYLVQKALKQNLGQGLMVCFVKIAQTLSGSPALALTFSHVCLLRSIISSLLRVNVR